MENKNATLCWNGTQSAVPHGATIASCIGIDAPCGGHGSCGKCKVIAHGALSPLSESEKSKLTAREIHEGVRLACRTLVLGDCTVTPYGVPEKTAVLLEGSSPKGPVSPLFRHYGVALDIGTTTLAARLYAVTGELLADCGRLNPQGHFGADVISRIEKSMNGKAELLAASIRGAIDEMLRELAKKAGIASTDIDMLCVTGNTAMLYLLTASDPTSLSKAPFAADRLFDETISAEVLGLCALSGNTGILLPPCISAFVGADTVCALLATGLCDRPTSALLADVGTNGEIALWSGNSLTVCSTAAGPAFEGAGITMGMRGAAGAIDRVQVANGRLIPHVIDDVPPVGICGSGLVDAVSCLLEIGELDETGYLEDDMTIAGPVKLFAKDIRMLQLAKSAVCAGIQTVLQQQSVTPKQVEALYIAGGFGSYLNTQSASRIGLFPRALCHKAKAVGNAALDGAALLLLDEAALERGRSLANAARTLNLSTSSVFADLYMTGMLLEEV